MPVTPFSKVAFRCKKCGRLHTSDDAAEAPHPHACKVCGAGVRFNPDGTKTILSDNWEHLISCSEERLQELGIDTTHVECHKEWDRDVQKESREPVHTHVTASDNSGVKDSAG